MFASIEQIEVSKILDNLMFELDKLQFTFGSLSCIGDLHKISLGSNI